MFRVLDVPLGDGPVEVVLGTERVEPPRDGVLRWIDLVGQTEEDVRLLAERFGFHPLAIEDLLHLDQRPKMEEYGEHLFVVTHGIFCPEDVRDLVVRELHTFLGARYLVTVHADPLPGLEMVWRRLAGEVAVARRGVDFIYYLVADAMVDENFLLLDRVSDALEEMETNLFEEPKARGELPQLFRLKKSLVTMRRILSPLRDVFAMMAKRGDPRIGERTALYFRDVYDHLVRIHEGIDAARDILGNILDAHLSLVANRTNEVMKRLTIMSAVFLPLTFITGFFGQNFAHLPYGSTIAMMAMIAACLLVPTGLLIWFYKSRWFH